MCNKQAAFVIHACPQRQNALGAAHARTARAHIAPCKTALCSAGYACGHATPHPRPPPSLTSTPRCSRVVATRSLSARAAESPQPSRGTPRIGRRAEHLAAARASSDPAHRSRRRRCAAMSVRAFVVFGGACSGTGGERADRRALGIVATFFACQLQNLSFVAFLNLFVWVGGAYVWSTREDTSRMRHVVFPHVDMYMYMLFANIRSGMERRT